MKIIKKTPLYLGVTLIALVVVINVINSAINFTLAFQIVMVSKPGARSPADSYVIPFIIYRKY